ncbi:unnamed protein product [Paramecium sonneborni]|uniref:Uncharacterized protein n=1 Tax=Paramecium sonneborni TaxID=65129 RepID=A0A8S1RWP3_9CILI|nr:unnamed protein product [Paramecium sonneborni]
MLGFKFQQCPYYSYVNFNLLQQQLNYENFGDTQIDHEQQMIEYFIDGSRCLRLQDLIYSIEVKFTKFHLGQLLVLFQKILEKIFQMEQQELEHNFLDQTRIWLTLEQNSPPLKITYQTIQYKINFTGYQCKLYENDLDESIKASEKILIIISSILQEFKEKRIACNNDNTNLQKIVNEIYDPIIQQCQKGGIIETTNIIINLLQKFQYENTFQTISFDDKYLDYYSYSLRDYRLTDIKLELDEFINTYGQYGKQLESILLLKVKKIGQNLDNFYSPKNEFENQEIENFLNLEKQFTQQNIKEIATFVEILTDNSIENNLSQYKFQISPDDRKIIYDSIQTRVRDQKLFKYFETYPMIFIQNRFRFQDNLRFIYQNLIKEIAEQEVELYVELQILMLIDELI